MEGKIVQAIGLFTVILAAEFATPSPILATSISLGTAGDFNTFIFGDFICNSDTEGRLAVGGNATLDGYDIGIKLDPQTGGDVLVVGNDLTLTSGLIHNGDAHVGGTANMPNYDAVEGELYVGGQLPIDFASEENYLRSLSSSLSQEAANGIDQVQWGNYYLTGDGQSDLQVFDLEGLSLQTVSSLVMANIPESSTILFNVSGNSSGLINMGFGSLGNVRNNVLFNFWEATTLDISGVGVEGSILAPLAHINAYNGVIYGSTIASSWSGPVQQNLHPFTSYTPEDSTPVPEPATMLLFGTGLAGMAGTLLKRKKK